MACRIEPGSSLNTSKDVIFVALYSHTLVSTSCLFNFLLCIEGCTNCDTRSVPVQIKCAQPENFEAESSCQSVYSKFRSDLAVLSEFAILEVQIHRKKYFLWYFIVAQAKPRASLVHLR